MWELCMHPNYDYFVYPINFQKMQSLLLRGSRFLKKNINFSGFRSGYNRLANRKKFILPVEKYFRTLKDMIIGTESFTIFQSGWNNGVKLWAFDGYSGAFPYKVTPDIDFTDEVVVQCDVPDVKVVLVIYKWSQINFGVNTYGWLMYCFWTQFCLHGK